MTDTVPSTASSTRPRGRRIAAAVLAAAGLLASACSSATEVENAAPRVTWVAVTPQDGVDRAVITVWLQDLEGDAVDLAIDWVDASGAATPIALAFGSYGLSGLPTRDALFDPNGQPSQLLWDTSGLSGSGRLRLVPDDLPYERTGLGDTVETPSFDVGAGLPEATAVTVVK
ncbi:MAG: hypothetical protein KC635_23480 [Myxococcales bacterium]|nr:hypothetical protein [Myxococcales bacterium]